MRTVLAIVDQLRRENSDGSGCFGTRARGRVKSQLTETRRGEKEVKLHELISRIENGNWSGFFSSFLFLLCRCLTAFLFLHLHLHLHSSSSLPVPLPKQKKSEKKRLTELSDRFFTMSSGWKQYVTKDEKKKIYYFNKETKETKWKLPVGEPYIPIGSKTPVFPPDGQAAPTGRLPDSDPSQPQLPDDLASSASLIAAEPDSSAADAQAEADRIAQAAAQAKAEAERLQAAAAAAMAKAAEAERQAAEKAAAAAARAEADRLERERQAQAQAAERERLAAAAAEQQRVAAERAAAERAAAAAKAAADKAAAERAAAEQRAAAERAAAERAAAEQRAAAERAAAEQQRQAAERAAAERAAAERLAAERSMAAAAAAAQAAAAAPDVDYNVPRAPAVRAPGTQLHDGSRAGRIADIEARLRALDQRESAMQQMFQRILELVQSR